MRIRFRHILCLCLLLPGVYGAWAQEAPPPEALLRRWERAQAERTDGLREIAFKEHARRTMDGATGRREAELDYDVAYLPQSNEWRWEPTAVRLDGRPVNLERRRAVAQLEGLLGPEFERFGRATLLPAALLARTRPAGPVLAETLDGVACWRFDVAMNAPRAPIQRITLWFDRRDGGLRQVRATLHTARLHLTSEIAYERVGGLDVPLRRRTEGTLQVVRRERTFAVDVTAEAGYSSYTFSFRDDR